MAEEGTKESGSAKPTEEPRTYHRDRLIAEGQEIFGQPGYVVEGALSQGRLSQKVNFTLDEGEKAIKQYLDHEVEIDHPEPAVAEEG